MNYPKIFHILVVDDDPKICDLFSVFTKVGTDNVKCVTANDAFQATLKMENQVFDLIFVDKQMPGKSGIEFITQLRKTIKHSRQNIVLMSGNTERADVLAAVELKVSEILVKPFTFAQFTDKLQNGIPNFINDPIKI